jgi:transcriptional regulator with XRE-family HTH domain
VPRRKIVQTQSVQSFGQRLAQYRQAAGYSQRELATELGISHRMVAYYETAGYCPLDLLPRFARVLGITTDALLGDTGRKAGKAASSRDTRLWRRFAQIEKLSPAERKPIIQVLDAFLAKAKRTTDDERRL